MGRRIEFSTKKQVKCPGTPHIGFSDWRAGVGDFIAYREDDNGGRRFARVIGVITKCDLDGPDGVGMLLVIAISDDGTFGYERWVKPEDVTECHRGEFARVFLGWLLNATPEQMRLYIRDDLETRKAATYSPP